MTFIEGIYAVLGVLIVVGVAIGISEWLGYKKSYHIKEKAPDR